jgi:hypothetical protein
MTATNIVTWAVAADAAGSPVIIASDPNAEECRSALALVTLNPAAKRYAVEPVGVTDAGFAARLAREAVAPAVSGGADWTRVRPGDLVPPEPAEPAAPAPERINLSAITPAHPRWAAEARTMLAIGGFDPDDPHADPERAEAGRRLIAEALAGGWTIKRLGHAILTEAAERADATHVDPRWHRSAPDPVALAMGAQPDPAALWSRVTRAPRQGETTLAERQRAGF